MGKSTAEIDPAIADFLRAQKLFFVATAPLARDGHVNVSPKGHDAFRVLGPRQVAYLDLTGSGVETIAHARENGRITLMFCAFEGAPKIVRLYGRATIFERSDAGFAELAAHFETFAGVRSIVRVDVERVRESCGYGVPNFRFEGERTTLVDWADREGRPGVVAFQRRHNEASVDGLPGLRDFDDG
jgi:hypothetical protein